MNVGKWLKKLAGKDPVDDDVKQKAQAAVTLFEETSEEIEEERAKSKKRETERKKKRKEAVTDIEECSQKVCDSIGLGPNGKKLTDEEVQTKMRELGWVK